MSPTSPSASFSGRTSSALTSPTGATRRNSFTWSTPKASRSCCASVMAASRRGRCAMFQIYFRDIGAILAKLAAQNWPIYLGPREVWRRTGDRESGQREVFVQDPGGYLIMVAHNIGERPLGDR